MKLGANLKAEEGTASRDARHPLFRVTGLGSRIGCYDPPHVVSSDPIPLHQMLWKNRPSHRDEVTTRIPTRDALAIMVGER